MAAALLTGLGAASAQAAPKGVVDFFGEPGSGAGQFGTPRGVAVNESTGHVYVVDSARHRIQQWDVFGTFVRAWGWNVDPTGGSGQLETCTTASTCQAGTVGAGAGQLNNPQKIAVDQDSGAVYVTSPNNRRVDKFDSSGNFLFAFGWGVDTGAAALQTCTTASTCQAGTSGANAGQFATSGTGAAHVAVDPRNGDVVVADPPNRRVQKFDSAGAFLFAFGWGVDTGAAALETCTTASGCQAGTAAGAGAGQFANNQPLAVAVDSAGAVYTAENAVVAGTFPQVVTRRVQKFNAAATSAGDFAPAHTSATSQASAPTTVAIDSSNDHVLVAKDRQVLELDGGGGLSDTHAAGSDLGDAAGLAVDGPGGRIYLTIIASGQLDVNRVFVLGPITPPSATIGPATEVGTESATFHGTVNPNGGALSTGYHFEYSGDGGLTWTSVPIPDQNVGNDTADVPVSEQATGLEPNTDYRVRLVASRPFAGGSDTSDEEATFKTDAAPPSIRGVGSSEITDTTAVLGGRVDPNHSHTTYHFEYGTDTSYGNSTPVGSAGSGARSVAVSKAITGLQPSTEYHFRLVASNPAGDTESADHAFTTDANPPQPSGRAYEMVSPLDKNGGNVERDMATGDALSHQTGAAASGDAVAYVARANFGDLETGAGALNAPNYLARRGDGGWSTEGLMPPVSGTFPGDVREPPRVPGLALDASRSFGVTAARLTPEAERLNGSYGLYMRSAGQAAGQRYTLISIPSDTLEPDPIVNFTSTRFEWEDSTPDARHVVFNSSRGLFPDDPAVPGDPPNNFPNALYEWADGTLRLVSVPPPGLSFTSIPTVIAGGGSSRMGSGVLHGDHVISDDGRRVFFTATTPPPAGRVLFVREDGAATRVVSASERPADSAAPPKPGDFWAAKGTDGSVAFFTSSNPLTADAVGTGAMLYRWDANAPEGQRLSAISPHPLGGAIGMQGPAAVSDDATSVYFVATGELAPGATAGQPNLYLWRQGQGVRYIATLDATGSSLGNAVDSPLWRREWRDIGGRGARVSPDGDRLLFASYAQLDPAYDTIEESAEDCGDAEVAGERCRQIYLYDAPSGRVSCLSCVSGTPVSGDANLFGNSDERRPTGPDGSTEVAPLDPSRNLSTDGRRAFFETARPLVTADENDAVDVYEWEDSDLDGEGELRLISSGRGASDALFLDATPLGDDVFFTSRDRLVGIDTDNQVDLYTARMGGGIAAQNPAPAPPPCEGEDCQGALSGAPFPPGVGSGGAGHGDLNPGARPTFSVARLSRKQQAQLARGRRVLVRVRTNRAGKVRLAARAKLGRRMRTVATASKTARKAGSVSLSLKLSRAALRELTRKRKLKVNLAVRFTGVREAKTPTVSLRRARGAGERRPR